MENIGKVTTHHDGHGLNELLEISHDAPEFGAPHRYRVDIRIHDSMGNLTSNFISRTVGHIQFQRGPRNKPGSMPGLTNEALLAIVADRLEHFQNGPLSCRENSLALIKIQEAMLWLRHRADVRARNGVLGTMQEVGQSIPNQPYKPQPRENFTPIIECNCGTATFKGGICERCGGTE